VNGIYGHKEDHKVFDVLEKEEESPERSDAPKKNTEQRGDGQDRQIREYWCVQRRLANQAKILEDGCLGDPG